MLWYLGFAAYSLYQVLVEQHCKKSSEQIICKSVVDLSLEANKLGGLLSISECLTEIVKNSAGKQIDLVIDEVDSEDLNEQEVKNINSILKKPEFKSSKIVIALQPCQKQRIIVRDQVKKITSICYDKLEGFKTFSLKKSMRFPNTICEIVKRFQEEIEEKTNTHFVNFPNNKSMEEPTKIEESIKSEQLKEEELEPKTGKLKIENTTVQQPIIKRMKKSNLTFDDYLEYSDANEGETMITSHHNTSKPKKTTSKAINQISYN